MPYFEVAEECPTYNANAICPVASCKRAITQKQPIFACITCGKLYHPQCKGIIGAAKIKKAAESSWFCSMDCSKAASSTPDNTNTPSKSNATTSGLQWEQAVFDLMKRMNADFAIVKTMIASIKDSQEFLCKEFDAMKSSIKDVVAENVLLSSKVECLENICQEQDQRICDLEFKLDGIEQRDLNSNIIVDGLPDTSIEPKDLADRIFQLLQCPELISDVLCCDYMTTKYTRMNANQSHSWGAKLIIKFKNPLSKKKVLQQKKSLKPTLCSNEIGYLHKKQQLFFRDHLTSLRHHLFREALKIKKISNCKYLWIHEGSILWRKTDGAIVTRIQSEADIKKLAASTQSSGRVRGSES